MSDLLNSESNLKSRLCEPTPKDGQWEIKTPFSDKLITCKTLEEAWIIYYYALSQINLLIRLEEDFQKFIESRKEDAEKLIETIKKQKDEQYKQWLEEFQTNIDKQLEELLSKGTENSKDDNHGFTLCL